MKLFAGGTANIPAFTQETLNPSRFVEHFQLAIDAIPTGMLVLDAADIIVLLNTEIEVMFGYTRAELLGKPVGILIRTLSPEHDSRLHDAHSTETSARAIGARRELHGLRKDGADIAIEIDSTPMRTIEGEFFLSSVADVTARRRAEIAQQQMNALFDSAGDAIIINDLDGTIRSWNPAAERLLGFGAGEIIGQPTAQIIPESRQHEELMILEQIRRGETVHHFETVRCRKDGSLVDVSLAISPIHARAGSVIGISEVMRDITDRKEIEAQWKKTHLRFASASEAAGLGFWDFDIRSNTLHWDDQMFTLYGRSRVTGEQPYALWSNSLHADDRSRSEQELTDALKGKRDFHTEFRVVHPNGDIRHLKASARVIRDIDGHPLLMTGVNVDITARKLMEQSREETLANLEDVVLERTLELTATLRRLEESHELIRVTLESIADAVITTGSQDEITWLNPSAESMSGWTRDEARARPLAEIFKTGNPENVSFSTEPLTIGLQLGERNSPRHYTTLISRNGAEYDVQYSRSPIRDSDGSILGAVLIIHDVTEQQRMQRRLRESSRRAGMAEIATGVLHNVGNVLNSLGVSNTALHNNLKALRLDQLRQASSMIRDHQANLAAFLAEDERGRHLPDYLTAISGHLVSEVELARAEVKTMEHLLQHLRDIVSAQQGYAKIGGLFEMVNLREISESALLALAPLPESIELVKLCEDNVPAVLSDRHKLLQILVNLISNARDAIQASPAGLRRIGVRVYRETDHAVVTVEDTGVGMSEEVRARLWQFGFSTKPNGHGFGLHNSANAAREIGATITVHSDGPGKGARFMLRLPLSRLEGVHH